MFFRKYRLVSVIAFISIFLSKMVISAAPVLSWYLDATTVKSVILQLEQEHGSEDDAGKSLVKFTDYKPIDLHYNYAYVPIIRGFSIRNCYVDHFRRYVDPYHPSVPTPPPNFS